MQPLLRPVPEYRGAALEKVPCVLGCSALWMRAPSALQVSKILGATTEPHSDEAIYKPKDRCVVPTSPPAEDGPLVSWSLYPQSAGNSGSFKALSTVWKR